MSLFTLLWENEKYFQYVFISVHDSLIFYTVKFRQHTCTRAGFMPLIFPYICEWILIFDVMYWGDYVYLNNVLETCIWILKNLFSGRF